MGPSKYLKFALSLGLSRGPSSDGLSSPARCWSLILWGGLNGRAVVRRERGWLRPVSPLVETAWLVTARLSGCGSCATCSLLSPCFSSYVLFLWPNFSSALPPSAHTCCSPSAQTCELGHGTCADPRHHPQRS